MKNARLFLFSLFILCTSFCLNAEDGESFIPSVSAKFHRLADFAKELVEKGVSPSYSSNFAKNIDSAAKEFEKAESLFIKNKNLFIKKKEVRNIFNELRKTIDYIDKSVAKSNDLKQSHIFWLVEHVVQIDMMARSVWPEINEDDKEFVKISKQQEIEFLTSALRFSMKMNDDVFPYLSKYVGTKFGYVRDFLIYKILKKYWWIIPLSILGATAIWSGHKYSKKSNQIDEESQSEDEEISEDEKEIVIEIE